MNKHPGCACCFAAVFLAMIGGNCSRPSIPDIFETVARKPAIDPDYAGCVIPPNIAPLNFMIKEEGRRFRVDLRVQGGPRLILASSKKEIRIPLWQWRALLNGNQGKAVLIDVYAQGPEQQWKQFASFADTIGREPIDEYCVYRLMPPLYQYWGPMGIYQRDLSDFAEKALWVNRMTENNCMNCHTFRRNGPDHAVFHMRTGRGNGTLIRRGDTFAKVNTATPLTRKAAGFASWHPDGTIIAFSVNYVDQFFHAIGNSREGFDSRSDIILYNTATNTESTSPKIASPYFFETYPEWSPDGKYLYFCRTPAFLRDTMEMGSWDRIKYDLMRARYYEDADTFGDPECVLSAHTTGKSILMPRISPDGRFLLFCAMPYGSFPVFRPGGDLCLMDLSTGAWYMPDINSPEPESHHSWSSNGRWIVFSSKRRDGICAQPFFSYIDTNGQAHKPFVMPQKNPDFYAGFLMTYNLPELIRSRFDISPQKLVSVAKDNNRLRNARVDARSLPAISDTGISRPVRQTRE